MENCPACGRPLVPFRAKMICRTPGCGFMENCCDGGWMSSGGSRNCARPAAFEPSELDRPPRGSLSEGEPRG